MKTNEEVTCMKILQQQGVPLRRMARELGVSRNTIRRHLRPVEGYARRARKSAIDPFKPWIVEHAERYEYNAIRLYQELTTLGYERGYEAVKRFVRSLRPKKGRQAFMRIETRPGDQAQVDWGEFKKVRLGSTVVDLHFFCMTLSWSRDIEGLWFLSEDLLTLERAHVAIFKRWGGIPRRLRYDNMKTVVQSGQGIKAVWNPGFLGFARRCGFKPEACHVKSPFEKGKVESSIDYVRHNFFPGRKAGCVESMQRQFDEWNNRIARRRIHGTTHERPMDRFVKEQPLLQALPACLPEPVELAQAQVYKDCHVSFQGNRYSVPHRWAGSTVQIHASQDQVAIYAQGKQVATHRRMLKGAHRHVTDPKHYQGLFETADTRPWLKSVQALVQKRDLSVYKALVDAT